MLMDAVDGICQQQVLFSNDSDCVPALQMIRQRYPTVQLGFVAPLIGKDDTRSGSSELKKTQPLEPVNNWHCGSRGLSDA